MTAHDDERAVFVDRYDEPALRQMARSPETPPRNLDKADVDSLAATLDLLAAANEGQEPDPLNLASYRAGARAAYCDAAARLREVAE